MRVRKWWSQVAAWRSEAISKVSSFVRNHRSSQRQSFTPAIFSLVACSSLIMADTSNTSPTSSSPPQDGSDFLPSNTWWNRSRNWMRMVAGNMSKAGQKKYWTDADERYEEFDCKRCEKHRDYLLQYSPVVRFMNDNIKKMGGEMGPHNIVCRSCRGDEEQMQGGFDHKYGIKLCANWVDERSKVEDVMAHEMVHAYDHLRFKTNLGLEDNLRHAACSEVGSSTELMDFSVANRRYRFGQATSAANVGGQTSSSGTRSSRSPNIIKTAFDEEPSFQ